MEESWPVNTSTKGFEYRTLIIKIKFLPKPIFSSTAHKNDHSLSKAFIASREKTAAGSFLSTAASIT